MTEDSTIARLTNNVRDNTGAASGCCAMAVIAAAAARPSPRAARKQPMATVRPAVMMEMIEIRAISVMSIPCFRLRCFSNGGGDIDQRQDGEDVSLDEPA